MKLYKLIDSRGVILDQKTMTEDQASLLNSNYRFLGSDERWVAYK